MHTLLKLPITLLLLLLLAACHYDAPPAKVIEPPTTPRQATAPVHATYIFGIYCAECGHHCADMYRYAVTDSGVMLDLDGSNDFFKKSKNTEFTRAILDTAVIAYAARIVRLMPPAIRDARAASQTFGCPDCSDGCGLYLEITDAGGHTRKNYIDAQPYKVGDTLRPFADTMKHMIYRMSSKVFERE